MRLMKRALALTASLTLVLALSPVSSAAADVGAQVNRESIACDKPSGKDVNFSWENGIVTTTLYYNNHCSQNQPVTVKLKEAVVPSVCLVTEAGTKTSVRYNASAITSVTKGC